MNVGSLFSGCLGLDLGLEAAGLSISWACESDAACQRVIARRRPELHVYPDVRELDASTPRVDLLAGGFPCQDLSYAGLGAGLEGERSGLWFSYADAIRLLRPRFVLVENVAALTRRGLGRVLYDLAEAGYVGSWIRLRACDVGAPHKRERIFILATDAGGERFDGAGGSDATRAPAEGQDGRGSAQGYHASSSDTDQPGHEGRESGAQAQRFTEPGRSDQAAPDADRAGRQADERERAGSEAQPMDDVGSARTTQWGKYGPAVERWERIIGRAAPLPTDERGRLNPELSEWMLGFPEGWTEGESRTARLRMLGNAVQVQCAELVGHLLNGGDSEPGP